MASVTELRRGLRDRLQTIPGLHAYATAPGQINVPAAVVTPAQDLLEFDATMGRGSDEFRLLVTVYAARADDELGQDTLDAFLEGSGASSVKAAVEAESSLGGVCDFAVVSRARNYGEYEYAGISYFGVELVVEVTA